jgi:hypothetical protein
MFNKENIMKIDFIKKIGNYKLEYIALFNKTKISDKEVRKAIQLHGVGEHPYVIFMSKEQFENVFGGKI